MKIDIPVSQPYRVDIAPGLLDDLGRYVSSGTAALVVTEDHVAPLLLERACRALRDAGVRAVRRAGSGRAGECCVCKQRTNAFWSAWHFYTA